MFICVCHICRPAQCGKSRDNLYQLVCYFHAVGTQGSNSAPRAWQQSPPPSEPSPCPPPSEPSPCPGSFTFYLLSTSEWMFICLMNECFSQSQETAAHLTSDWASLDRQVWERLLWLTVAVLTCLLASLPLTASLPEP